MKTISYKGYQASVEFEDGVLFVKVLHIDDLLVGQCNSASETLGVLADLIDAYMEDCAEIGRDPTKPFKGTFNIRMNPELHRRAAWSAAEDGVTLNNWIQSAVEEKLECEKLSDRIDGVMSEKLEISHAAFEMWVRDRAEPPEIKETSYIDTHGRPSSVDPVIAIDFVRKVRTRNYA
jgi:predicted HicB family RNase H-like nuclease